MPEITKKRRGELVRGVFRILSTESEGLQAAIILARLVQLVPPTSFELSHYESSPNTRRYEKIVRFSTITAVKAGWLVKEKGTWFLTEEGKSALARYPDAEIFESEARKLYQAWKKDQPADENGEVDDVVEPVTTLEEAEEAAWADIRSYLGSMPPYDFQELVAALLRAMGYRVDWVAPPGPDRGIDIVAYADALGTTGPRVKVQVKRQPETKAGADALRSFLAVLGEQDVGLYVCSGGFSADAQREARSQEKRRIVLVDDTRLVELWIEHYDRLGDADRMRLPLRPIYFLAPSD